MLNRRAFLLASAGMGASTVGGLILPEWLRQAERFIEAEDKPLIEHPRQESTVINAFNLDGENNYRLVIGDPYEEPPAMTWLEYYRLYHGDEYESFTEFTEEFFGGPAQPHAEADSSVVLDTWLASNEAPDTAAYHYLEQMDIGPVLGDGDTVGQIDFVNCPCPGNDSRFVTVPDLLSLSLLQKRLNHVDGTTLVRLWNTV